MLKIAKFGGSSLSDAGKFIKMRDIVLSDGARKIVVVSACGKRFPADEKITDLLYKAYSFAKYGGNCVEPCKKIRDRLVDVSTKLGLKTDIEGMLDGVFSSLDALSESYVVSRGEYLSARVAAEILAYEFADAKDLFIFDYDGKINDAECFKRFETLPDRVVIPGFYGGYPNGEIKLFPRGGSDLSGAYAAKFAGADLYENWTDVRGVMNADPFLLPNAETVRRMTYGEVKNLSFLGANVLQEDTVSVAESAGVPINVRCSSCPCEPGTLVSREVDENSKGVIGVAVKSGYTVISVETNGGARALYKLFEGLKAEKIEIEFCALNACGYVAAFKPRNKKSALFLTKTSNFKVLSREAALLGIVASKSGGREISEIFSALEDAGVRIFGFNTAGERTLTILTDNTEKEKATRAICRAAGNT